MMEVGAFEAKNTLGGLLDRVEKGEEIIITRHGKRVARLVPDRPQRDPVKVRAAIEAIAELREQLRASGTKPFSIEEIISARDEGRR